MGEPAYALPELLPPLEPPPYSAKPLTRRQRDVLNFILAHLREFGFPPSLREMGEHFGIRSTNGVNDHLRALERKGYIRRYDMASRAIRVLRV